MLTCKVNISKMVFFGRKEKIEDRRLLASMDAVNGTKMYQVENGNINNFVENKHYKMSFNVS